MTDRYTFGYAILYPMNGERQSLGEKYMTRQEDAPIPGLYVSVDADRSESPCLNTGHRGVCSAVRHLDYCFSAIIVSDILLYRSWTGLSN